MAGRLRHLATRFLTSLWPAGPSAADEAWADDHLVAGERALWHRMSGPDRRHAVAVARRTVAQLGPTTSRPVVAAALLHDVGKLDAGLGTFGRVAATLAGAVGGHDMAPLWAERRGFTRRVGLYLCHPELGAARLALAGSDPVTIEWARQHHTPPDRWTIDPAVAHALKDADDD